MFNAIPLNRTKLKTPVILSKRIVAPRAIYTNNRKRQVKLGQIVYVTQGKKVVPMRVIFIDDCSLWSKSNWKDRTNFCIYYDLQPLMKTHDGWKAKPWVRFPIHRKWSRKNKSKIHSGWIGHSLDMGSFNLTSAEANWCKLFD